MPIEAKKWRRIMRREHSNDDLQKPIILHTNLDENKKKKMVETVYEIDKLIAIVVSSFKQIPFEGFQKSERIKQRHMYPVDILFIWLS